VTGRHVGAGDVGGDVAAPARGAQRRRRGLAVGAAHQDDGSSPGQLGQQVGVDPQADAPSGDRPGSPPGGLDIQLTPRTAITARSSRNEWPLLTLFTLTASVLFPPPMSSERCNTLQVPSAADSRCFDEVNPAPRSTREEPFATRTSLQRGRPWDGTARCRSEWPASGRRASPGCSVGKGETGVSK